MGNAVFGQVLTAMVTPFDKSGAIQDDLVIQLEIGRAHV